MTDYATLEDYKSWIVSRGGEIAEDGSDDAVILTLLSAVSRYIERQTGRRFYSDSVDGTYYFQAKNSQSVRLPDFASITSVSVDYSNNRSYTTLTVSTDYDLVPDNYSADGVPINGLEISPLSTSYGYFPTQRKGIKIVGKKGWPAVPDDIEEAVLSISQNLYGSRSGQTSSGKITVTAAGVVIRPEDVPAFAAKIISHYRNYL